MLDLLRYAIVENTKIFLRKIEYHFAVSIAHRHWRGYFVHSDTNGGLLLICWGLLRLYPRSRLDRSWRRALPQHARRKGRQCKNQSGTAQRRNRELRRHYHSFSVIATHSRCV